LKSVPRKKRRETGGKLKLRDSEDGGGMFLRNVGLALSPKYMALKFRVTAVIN
jgi:hypothetical protein